MTDGTLAKEGSSISIRVSFCAFGSEGGHGKNPPLSVLLKCLAFWHCLTGMKSASFTTPVISEPEYLYFKIFLLIRLDYPYVAFAN